MKKTILAVLGTRPEAVKMSSVIWELQARESLRCVLCTTGQHRELLGEDLLGELPPSAYRLEVMEAGQSLSALTRRILEGVDGVIGTEKPDLVLVQGDTTTAFAAALAAFYRGIPVGHVEAGLRTYDRKAPFPEEWNRRGIGILADYHFAPTLRAKERLLREGVPAEGIAVTGNPGLDTLKNRILKDFSHPLLDWSAGSRLLLLTTHRRENRGDPMEQIFRGVRRAVEEFSAVKLIFPVHPHPGIRDRAERILGDCPRIRLTPPMAVGEFQNLMARSDLVLTDSGGIQEEAAFLHKPVLVLRKETERVEGLEAGVSRLIGVAEESVYRGVYTLLENDALREAMGRGRNPYGDGTAGKQIADRLEEWMEQKREKRLYFPCGM